MASLFRSSSRLGQAAARFTSGPKPSPFRLPKKPPASPRVSLLRSVPVAASCFCFESLLPLHSATASSLMTSMLFHSRGCLCLGISTS